MDIVIWVAVVVVALLMLWIGGRALKLNQRVRTRPFQPTYRDDIEPKYRDDGEWP